MQIKDKLKRKSCEYYVFILCTDKFSVENLKLKCVTSQSAQIYWPFSLGSYKKNYIKFQRCLHTRVLTIQIQTLENINIKWVSNIVVNDAGHVFFIYFNLIAQQEKMSLVGMC